MSMIQATNLTKKYGDVTAVDGLEFEVEEGSIHGFVGPNGAGKTTTMQLLLGLLSPTEGDVYIDDHEAGTIDAKELIGYAPQEPGFYESMTGREYLEYMGQVAGMGSDALDRADELLDWLDLTDAADQAVGGYSGGMQRRVSLGQAMIHEPELLILDEPTAALDPSGRSMIIESLESLTEEGMTVFVSSHVLAELEQFIEDVTIIADGQLVESGSLESVQSEYGGQTFRIDTADDERVSDLLSGREWTSDVRLDEGDLIVTTEEPETFKGELQQLLTDEGILLEGLQEEGGLQEAFSDIVNGDESASDGGEDR